MEEKPAEAEEVNPDDEEEASPEEAEEIFEPEEVTLDSLIIQFVQGKSNFLLFLSSWVCHFGGSCAVSHHFIVLLSRGNRNV